MKSQESLLPADNTLPVSSAVYPATQTKPLRKQYLDFEISLTRDQLVGAIAALLLAMIEKNKQEELNTGPSSVLTPFHMKSLPKISLQSYLKRLADHLKCSDVCFLIALIYIDRVLKQDESMELDALNIYKLIAMTLTAATKYIDENSHKNDWYAKITGIKFTEFNELEKELFDSIKLDLSVDDITLKGLAESVAAYYSKTQKESSTQ